MKVLPSFANARSTRAYLVLVAFRILFFASVVFVLDSLLRPGTSPVLLAAAAGAATLLVSKLAFSRLKTPAVITLAGMLFLSLFAAQHLAYLLPVSGESHTFMAYNWFQHLHLALIVFSGAGLLTWCFWRFRYFLTFEILIFTSVFVKLLSAHRDYRLDAPLIINTLSWNLGIDQLLLLVWLGVAAVSSLLLYFFFVTLPDTPRPQQDSGEVVMVRSSRSRLASLLATAGAVFLLFLVGRELYQYHNRAALTRIAEGVGQESQEGLSPLGFHSALGSTNQPAALVRLEGDYKENPTTPMLYLRESALSQFNGRELVIASHDYDKDVSYSAPGSEYAREEEPDQPQRKSLTQSVFLIADHKNAFAIDYPVSLRPLKNPNVKRFRDAYQAVSLVPTYSKEELKGAIVGNPTWNEAALNLYLTEHPDGRYKELALNIAGVYLSPLDRIEAITNWLSRNATYTLTPNHNEKPEDPVAPFLFGDLRGYCVHFAHAMVYLFRSLGIPARIGTGYLSDLSQSRDGHLLLRMSDRHAWAEVYMQGKGWVPFDVQPDKVESHAETQVDMKMLEDLMQMLDPGSELMPPDIMKGEKVEQGGEMLSLPLPTRGQLMALFAALAILLLCLKVFLLWGWRVTSAPSKRLKRAYRSLAAFLLDLGIERREGETHEEFSCRLETLHRLRLAKITEALDKATYSERPAAPAAEIAYYMIEARKSFSAFSRLQRLVPIFPNHCRRSRESCRNLRASSMWPE